MNTRPKTAPAGGRRTRTLFGVPVAHDDSACASSPEFKPAPSSGAASSMSTARATPRNRSERGSPLRRAADHGNFRVNGGSNGNNLVKRSRAAVSFLLGSTPATPGQRPSTAPSRRPGACDPVRAMPRGAVRRPSSAKGTRDSSVVVSPGDGWAITQAASPPRYPRQAASPPRYPRQAASPPRYPIMEVSPALMASPTSPRGEGRSAVVVSPRGGRSIGEEVPRVANPDDKGLIGGFGYIAPHSGWASAHAAAIVSPRSKELAKERTPAKPKSPYEGKQGRPKSARTLSDSSSSSNSGGGGGRPYGGSGRARPSSARSLGGTHAC